ncbi:heterogeneous nuclear ribonucleoprotein 27C-like isoform X1 [Panonychus citri]|uniref:heterogeneous nuclear ribonucleoprotein 27C-like isoform X1 n=1 Tax=Panonychus citri TaxID=50023 RepID=UPI0023072425|nr:heterogeneous nuclear ribonucleoprotein 27C-like isoform X1 [Panonychus citri]
MTQDTEEEVGKLFVGGLSWETTKEKLNDYFSAFGEIADCVVMKNPETGRSRGFGFVTFKDPNCVQLVLNAGPHHLDERTIDPKSCNPKSAQKGKREAKMSNYPKIFLGGLPSDVNETVLRQFFTQYGKVVEVVIMYDQERKKTRGNGFRGFGFLSFESEEAVNKLVDEHYVVISGKKVEVKRAEPREKTILNGLTLNSNNGNDSTDGSTNGISVIPGTWWSAHFHPNHPGHHQSSPTSASLPPQQLTSQSHGNIAAAVAAAAAAAAAAVNNSGSSINLTGGVPQVNQPIGLPGTGLIQTTYPVWTSLPGWVPTSPSGHHRLTNGTSATLGSPNATSIPSFNSPNLPNPNPGPGPPPPPPPHPSTWNGHPASFYPTPYPPHAPAPWHPSGYPYPGLAPMPHPHGLWTNQSYPLYGSSYPVSYSGYLPGAPISPGLSPSSLTASLNLSTVTGSGQQQTGSCLNAQPTNHLTNQNGINLPTSSQISVTTNSSGENCPVSSNAHETGNGQTNGLMTRANQQSQSAHDFNRDVSNYLTTRIFGYNQNTELIIRNSNNNNGQSTGNHNNQSTLGPSFTRSSATITNYHPYRRVMNNKSN